MYRRILLENKSGNPRQDFNKRQFDELSLKRSLIAEAMNIIYSPHAFSIGGYVNINIPISKGAVML